MDDQTQSDGIKIKIKKKYEYIDYEEYEIQVTNQNEFPIKLDTKETTDTVYINDENGVNYSWRGNEIDTNKLTIEPNESKVFRIKFNKMYSATRLTNAMYFTNVIKEDGSNEEIELSINI